MSITKIIAMLIPIVALAIWAYFFIVEQFKLYKFFLVVALVPTVFVSFYIALLVWRKSRPKSTIVKS